MGYKSQKDTTPAKKMIVDFLASRPTPQSAIDISDAIGCTYWHSRNVVAGLVDQGRVIRIMVGKSPHYTLPVQQKPHTEEVVNDGI
jgi:hypothetical protein